MRVRHEAGKIGLGTVALILLMSVVTGLIIFTSFPESKQNLGQFYPDSISLREKVELKELLDDQLVFIDPAGSEWAAPRGTLTDGASIPRLFLPITDGRWDPAFLKAAVVHDAYCQKENKAVTVEQYCSRPWQDIHRMFYEACIAGGTPPLLAKTMFAAVWWAGPRCDDPDQQLDSVPDEMLNRAVAGSGNWIESADPSIDEIVVDIKKRKPVLKELSDLEISIQAALDSGDQPRAQQLLENEDKLLQRGLDKDPDDLMLRYFKGYSHMNHAAVQREILGEEAFNEELDRSREIFDGILSANPNDPIALRGVSRNLFHKGDLDGAAHFGRKALDAAPDYQAVEQDLRRIDSLKQATENALPQIDPVAHWNFDNCDAREKGARFDGSINGNPGCADGIRGKALSFDGNEDFITIDNIELGNLHEEATISFWMKPHRSNFENGDHRILEKDTGNYWVFLIHEGQLILSLRDNVGLGPPDYRIELGGASDFSEKWTFLAVVKSGTQFSVYINGKAVQELETEIEQVVTSAPVSIGRSSYWRSQYYAGLLDEIMFFEHALSADQISELYQESRSALSEACRSPNLLRNGSFEAGRPPGRFKVLRSGSEAIEHWSVTRDSIDYIGSLMPASDGSRHIDLDGTPGFGSIRQTFDTQANTDYLVLFDLAGNTGGPPDVKNLQVAVAGTTSEFAHGEGLNWTTRSMEFTATASLTTLEFISADLEGGYAGPLLDNVRVCEKAACGSTSLAGDWSYLSSGNMKVAESDGRIRMDLTWMPRSATGVHYTVDASFDRQACMLSGRWEALVDAPDGVSTSGEYAAQVTKDGQLTNVVFHGADSYFNLNGLQFSKTQKECDEEESSFTREVSIRCSSNELLCKESHEETIESSGTLQIQFDAHPAHCGAIRIRAFLDDVLSLTSDVLHPPGSGKNSSTGLIPIEGISLGTRNLRIQAEGVITNTEGDCIAERKKLESWGGNLTVVTSCEKQQHEFSTSFSLGVVSPGCCPASEYQSEYHEIDLGGLNSGEIVVELKVGNGESAGTFHLYFQEHGGDWKRVKRAIDVPAGRTRVIRHSFEKPGRARFMSVGNWFSREGATNTVSVHAVVTGNK